MKEYIINKILSNNVVLVNFESQKYILVGKGIGFNKKRGEIICGEDIIEETFISLSGMDGKEQEEFINMVDPKIIELTENIIEMVTDELEEELNPNIHLGLIDHINFAIKRISEGIEIVNPFMEETKILYPKEYSIAEEAVDYLKNQLKIEIPETEIGFIALHIFGSRKERSRDEGLKYSQLLKDIVDYVENKMHTSLREHLFIYSRFIMHLRGLLNRVEKEETVDNVLMEHLSEKLSYEISIAEGIGIIIENRLKKKVPKGELGYIALHLHKMNNK